MHKRIVYLIGFAFCVLFCPQASRSAAPDSQEGISDKSQPMSVAESELTSLTRIVYEWMAEDKLPGLQPEGKYGEFSVYAVTDEGRREAWFSSAMAEASRMCAKLFAVDVEVVNDVSRYLYLFCHDEDWLLLGTYEKRDASWEAIR